MSYRNSASLVQAEDQDVAIKALREDVQDATLLLNVEYKIEKTIYASLTVPGTKVDVGKGLVAEAFLMLDPRREKRLQKIVSIGFNQLRLLKFLCLRRFKTQRNKETVFSFLH